MSRLYVLGGTDTRKTPLSAKGDERVTLTVFYGSKQSSKVAVAVQLYWHPEESEPRVAIVKGNKVLDDLDFAKPSDTRRML